MMESQLAEFTLHIGIDSGDLEQLDRTTRELLGEVRNLDIESADLIRSSIAPEGTKAIDPVTLGAIALVVGPSILPKLVDFLQSWVMRQSGRTIKFKGKIGDRDIEYEGALEDLKTLLSETSKP